MTGPLEPQPVEAHARWLLESSVDPMLAVDRDLIITDVNEQMIRLTGFTREQLVGVPFQALFADVDRAAECLQMVLRDGVTKDFELGVRVKGGEEVAVSLNASVFRDNSGKVMGVFAAARDITERQRLENARALLASVVTSSRDAICTLDPQGTITSWNAGAERLYGYSAKEAIGRSDSLIVPLECRVEMAQYINTVFRSDGIHQFDTRRVRKDGSQIDVALTLSPLYDKPDKVSAISVIARDITERKRFEAEMTKARDAALEAARLKSYFLANMSHEIRTPLNSIIGLTGLLLDNKLEEEQTEFVHDIRQSGEALLTIVNDILDFSKISAGKLIFETIDFELCNAVEGAVDLIADQARAKGLELAIAIAPDAPRLLCGDPGRLRQVLANLLSNAVKFTQRGEIVVSASKFAESGNEATLRFEVRDTGVGLSPQAQLLLFQPFAQVDSSTSRKYGGTGLGLAIARELVERMHGRIGVISTPAVGSTFWFTARFDKQPATAQAPLPAPSVKLDGLRVLVVDDSASNREIIGQQLNSWGMVVETASGPEEGFTMLREAAKRETPFAVAILDLEMPVMDGLELARRILGAPDITGTALLLASSGGRSSELRARAESLGVKAFLLKPLKQSELVNALTHLISRPAAAVEPLPSPSAYRKLAPIIAPLHGANGEKFRVLVAEDNIINQKVVMRQLHKLGCEADAVANGREALQAVLRLRYGAVLMDCEMPELDGYDATREIRAHEGVERHTRIIAMTAHALPGDRQNCLEAGMDDYLAKPVKLEDLVAVLSHDSAAAKTPAGADEAPSGAATSEPADKTREATATSKPAKEAKPQQV